MQKKIFLFLLLVPVLIIGVNSTYAITPDECTTAKIEINNQIKNSRQSSDMNWYAAGMVLGNHYVMKDCDTAKEKINEMLDYLWTAEKDHTVPNNVIDDVRIGLLYVKAKI